MMRDNNWRFFFYYHRISFPLTSITMIAFIQTYLSIWLQQFLNRRQLNGLYTMKTSNHNNRTSDIEHKRESILLFACSLTFC